MQILENLKKTYNPNFSLLLVNRKGIIQDASLNSEHSFVYGHDDFIKKPLQNLFRPLGFSTGKFLKLADIAETEPCPLDMYVQVSHPTVTGESCIFHYTFSSWFVTGNKKHTVISLAPHTYNSPIAQELLTLYRSENVPTILLDSGYRTVSYNYHFHEILNFIDDDTFYNKSVIPLLENEYQNPNPFLHERKTSHIQEIALGKGSSWQTAYDFFENGVPKSSEAAGLHGNHTVSMTRLRDSVLFARASGIAPTGRFAPPVLTSVRGFNTAEQDIEINLKINGKRQCSITLIPGHPLVSNKSLFKFDAGYHVDIDVRDHIFICFWRRSAPLFSCTVKSTMPLVSLRRTGAYFELYCDKKKLFDYADPRPVFNHLASHISAYIWDGEMEMTQLSVKTRPTAFNIEEMEEQDPQIVAFANAPDKPFKFLAEPVSYCGIESALAVRFFPVPVFTHKGKKDYYLSLFESTREYIQKNYFRSIDFHSLARQCCVSHKHYIKKFKKLFGLSPKAYQTDIRLKEAHMLLRGHKMKVVEVAETVGIDDPKNFQKMFKKRFKCAPGELGQKEKAL